MQLRPVARAVGLDQAGELGRVGVALVEPLEVMRGRVDEQRPRPGQRRQEEGVGPRPGIAHGKLVDDLDRRQLLLDQEIARRPDRAELGIVGDVLPPVAEVLGRERRAVRPAMACPQMEGEALAVLDVDRSGEVRHQLERAVVADQPGVAVDHQQAGVAAAADQGLELAAGLAVPAIHRGQAGLGRRPGAQRRRHGRQQQHRQGSRRQALCDPHPPPSLWSHPDY